jgi:hypothetical protein
MSNFCDSPQKAICNACFSTALAPSQPGAAYLGLTSSAGELRPLRAPALPGRMVAVHSSFMCRLPCRHLQQRHSYQRNVSLTQQRQEYEHLSPAAQCSVSWGQMFTKCHSNPQQQHVHQYATPALWQPYEHTQHRILTLQGSTAAAMLLQLT